MERADAHTETNLLWKITEETSAAPPPCHGAESLCRSFTPHPFIPSPRGDCAIKAEVAPPGSTTLSAEATPSPIFEVQTAQTVCLFSDSDEQGFLTPPLTPPLTFAGYITEREAGWTESCGSRRTGIGRRRLTAEMDGWEVGKDSELEKSHNIGR